jgi:hypothetical protein
MVLVIGAIFLFLGMFTAHISYQNQSEEHRVQAEAEQHQTVTQEQRQAQENTARQSGQSVQAQSQQ